MTGIVAALRTLSGGRAAEISGETARAARLRRTVSRILFAPRATICHRYGAIASDRERNRERNGSRPGGNATLLPKEIYSLTSNSPGPIMRKFEPPMTAFGVGLLVPGTGASNSTRVLWNISDIASIPAGVGNLDTEHIGTTRRVVNQG